MTLIMAGRAGHDKRNKRSFFSSSARFTASLHECLFASSQGEKKTFARPKARFLLLLLHKDGVTKIDAWVNPFPPPTPELGMLPVPKALLLFGRPQSNQ